MKILIADDEKSVCTVFSHHIRMFGSPYIEIKMVHNGQDLKMLCEEWKPEIIFTDICMPRLSGLEAIDEIRRSQAAEKTNIYIISGYSDFDYARQALKLGVKDYLLKPIRYEQVVEILNKEERKLYLGLDLKEAYQIGDEQKAIEASLTIQQFASAFMLQDLALLLSTIEKWKKLTMDFPILISPAYFKKKFDVTVDTPDQQLAFFEQESRNPRFSKHSGRSIDAILTYMTARFSDSSFCIDMVADHFGYSAQYLSLFFKKEVGENFSTYLTKLRINKAKELLTIPTMKIKEIATECGYSYPSYFIKVFSKETGMTPAEWKKEKQTAT